MSRALAGRATIAIGAVLGLLAIGLLASTGGFRYVEDGTAVGFLIAALACATWVATGVDPKLDTVGAAAGAAAFGFFLFFPASAAFGSLGYLGAGAWLGICTALIPIGSMIVWSEEPRPATSAGSPAVATSIASAARNPALLLSSAGLALVLVGIWLDAEGGTSFWNASSSGHALGILLLLAVALNVVLVAAALSSDAPAAKDAAYVVAAATFGLVEAEWIVRAFESLGSLGEGAWIEAVGGLALMLGAVVMWTNGLARVRALLGMPAPAAS